MRPRLLLPGLLITLFIIVLLPAWLHSQGQPRKVTEPPAGVVEGPAPFDRIGKIVSIREVVEQWKERGLQLYLPGEVPKGLNLAAVWAVERNGSIGNTIILVYSETKETKISTAELTIEIEPIPMPWHVSDPSKERFVKIGNWTVYINEKAPIYEPEYREKFGVDYCIIVDVVIKGINYQFCFAPTIPLNDVLFMVRSMKPATPP